MRLIMTKVVVGAAVVAIGRRTDDKDEEAESQPEEVNPSYCSRAYRWLEKWGGYKK
ncbi:MAG: hypothetical protein HXS44_06560 [Theionarchaea archaeon]|nr:hypothetical protein [Theionarchaea archaeon]